MNVTDTLVTGAAIELISVSGSNGTKSAAVFTLAHSLGALFPPRRVTTLRMGHRFDEDIDMHVIATMAHQHTWD